jgi:hypothetical protein
LPLFIVLRKLESDELESTQKAGLIVLSLTSLRELHIPQKAAYSSKSCIFLKKLDSTQKAL